MLSSRRMDTRLVMQAQRKAGSKVHAVANVLHAYNLGIYCYNLASDEGDAKTFRHYAEMVDRLETKLRRFVHTGNLD